MKRRGTTVVVRGDAAAALLGLERKPDGSLGERAKAPAACCYAGCPKAPSFSLWLEFRAEHGGKHRVPMCAEHAGFLTLNDSFVPAATFAGQDVHDCGPWSDWSDTP